jgi:beta-galactosidase
MRPAGWVPCPDISTARAVSGRGSKRGGGSDRSASPWWSSLDGDWDFELLDRPEALDATHLGVGALASTAEVPGAWTTQGHGNPIYTNVAMPFAGEPPAVPDDNPTAVYRRTIEVPAGWRGRRVVLQVGAAESMAMVYLDGHFVGFGTDTHLSGDFDLSAVVEPGASHTLALVVPRWSAGTWLEDQDQWFHGGLQRSVALYSTAETRVATAKVTGGLAGLPGRPGGSTTGTLEVDLLVEGPGCTEPGWTVGVRLETLRGRELASSADLEVPHWDDSELFLQLAGSMFTESGRVRTHLDVPGITPWSAENPELYRVVVTLADPNGAPVEVGALSVGFRTVEVLDRQLLINGAPVVLRGVNMHEHDPLRGRAVGREHARRDLVMLKGANLNAVRGAHYPHAEHFAELCDELGLYVIDEANVESHAREWSLCHDSRFDAAVLARVMRMAERDVHHPSVIMWSLGNESGYGRAHDAAAAALRRFDGSRPLHYEGPFMFDLDAEAPVSDVVCPMYTPVEEIVDWAQRSEDPRRPLILCEYSHAMGNACGSLVDYDDAFENHDGLQGGFIWEWCEHGIPVPGGATGPSGAPSWGYAGDFGTDSEEGNFVLDGLVGADRNPHPALEEVRYLGRPVRARLVSSAPGRAEVDLTNQRWFSDTSDLHGHWELSVDGEVVAVGELPKRPIVSRGTIRKVLRWRRDLQIPGAELHLTVRWTLAVATAWAPEGHVVGWDQFALDGRIGSAAVPDRTATTTATESTGAVLSGFVPFAFTPSVFRALTDNDGIAAGWMRGLNGSLARWVDELGLDRCSWDPDEGLLQPGADVPPVRVNAKLSDAGGGWQRLKVDFELPEELADPPRLGITWQLPASLEYLEFFADGPFDCYPDRRSAAVAGRWRSTASDQYVDYGMPQEHGHHTGLRWVALRTRRGGPGLLVVAGPTPDRQGPGAGGVGFSARHHSDAELWSALHTGDLTPLDDATATWLSVDVAQRGLGQSSLGPETSEQYRIPAGTYHLDLLLRHLRGGGSLNADPASLYARRPG